MLEWVAYPFSSRYSWPRNRTRVSCIAGGCFTNSAIREGKKLVQPVWKTVFAGDSAVENPRAMQEMQVRSLGQEGLLEKEMATHSSTLAWKTPWMKEPGRLQSMGLQRVRHDWTTKRRRQWHPTPVLLPGKPHGWRSLVGCSPWDRWGSDTTERLHFHFSLSCIGEGNGNPLQCSCLENPRDRGAWWAAIYGVAQSRTRLKRLSSRTTKQQQLCKTIWRVLKKLKIELPYDSVIVLLGIYLKKMKTVTGKDTLPLPPHPLQHYLQWPRYRKAT